MQHRSDSSELASPQQQPEPRAQQEQQHEPPEQLDQQEQQQRRRGGGAAAGACTQVVPFAQPRGIACNARTTVPRSLFACFAVGAPKARLRHLRYETAYVRIRGNRAFAGTLYIGPQPYLRPTDNP